MSVGHVMYEKNSSFADDDYLLMTAVSNQGPSDIDHLLEETL